MTRVKLLPIILALVLLLCSCGKSETVLTVGGEKVSYDTYRYFYLNYKAENEDYTEEELHQKAVDAISMDIALTLLAKSQDVGLNRTEKKSVDDYVEASVANYGGKEAYREALEKNHLTDELFRYFYSQQLLENKLREYMYLEMNNIIKSDDATVEADIKENFMAAKQVLIRHDNGQSDEKNKATAEEILKRAQNGEDFDALIKEYSEDTTALTDYVYYFTYGQMVEGFEKAVTDTSIGKICEYVAKSEAGYHIVMRMPLDEGYIDNHFEQLRDAYKARCFNDMRKTLTESFEVEKSKDFDSLDFNE
ncbi:MAG: peptidylprolyl isomerase [Clostridia bacterium]|nr:peptidylprolyl isomerase [Clostridia bacterium]